MFKEQCSLKNLKRNPYIWLSKWQLKSFANVLCCGPPGEGEVCEGSHPSDREILLSEFHFTVIIHSNVRIRVWNSCDWKVAFFSTAWEIGWGEGEGGEGAHEGRVLTAVFSPGVLYPLRINQWMIGSLATQDQCFELVITVRDAHIAFLDLADDAHS